ncbi:MAG: DHH family phosphoesterase [Candidatus Hadarchaeales archaeon]
MLKPFEKAARIVNENRHKEILVISHSDADGVCAAAIISKCLEREGIEYSVKFVETPHKESFKDMPSADLTILADVGSSLLDHLCERFSNSKLIILDHHEIDQDIHQENLVHLNAHLLGMDGGIEISGAGMAYLFALVLDEKNVDLSHLAIIGALGDAQDLWGELKGYNRRIAEIAVKLGLLRRDIDLLLYGRHSRPIYKALANFTDPFIPGVSNSPSGCLQLLKELGIEIKNVTKFRRPVDLTEEEKSRLASEIIVRASLSAPPELSPYVPRLVLGEVFSLPQESEESGLKDVDEFATSLNAVAKQNQPILGLEVAKGDRGGYYAQMQKLLNRYRRKIAESLGYLEGTEFYSGPLGYLQFFDATEYASENLVGTIVGMCLSSGFVDPYRPVLGMVRKNGFAKISTRCSKLLALKNINLAKAIRETCREIGGEGGGHATAGGALIEEDKINKFIEVFERNLLMQHQT